jgi:hypothetical protein
VVEAGSCAAARLEQMQMPLMGLHCMWVVQGEALAPASVAVAAAADTTTGPAGEGVESPAAAVQTTHHVRQTT